MAGDQAVQHLPLPRGQALQPVAQGFRRLPPQLLGLARLQRRPDRAQQVLVVVPVMSSVSMPRSAITSIGIQPSK